MQIPIDQIDDTALPRDRSLMFANAQTELQNSISVSGLRQPIEVFKTDQGYALISGYRRLSAFRTLAEARPNEFSQIPAILREPADITDALHAMVEENDIRAEVSPWERAAIAHATHNRGLFDTLDAAFAKLYPYASRQKRAKLRGIAEVISALDGLLIDPETMSESRLLRIANVLRLGWQEIIVAALEGSTAKTTADQWQVLHPVLAEAETLVADAGDTSPHRPKRLSHPHPGVTIRRERTRHGYLLHVTGRNATDMLVAEILDNVEHLFSPA